MFCERGTAYYLLFRKAGRAINAVIIESINDINIKKELRETALSPAPVVLLYIHILLATVKTGTSFMNRSTKLIMPHDLCFRILMFENRQQVKQRKTLRLRSRICRTAFFIQSTFIADSNTVPVESSHMRSRFRYRPAMVKFPIAGDVKMITYILETSLQMTLSKLLYGEGNIAARCAAMNHQQLNLTWEIAFF